MDPARLWDTDNSSQSYVIENCGELFMVGESFEQTEKMNSGHCGEHFTAGEHFVDDESFTIVDCCS